MKIKKKERYKKKRRKQRKETDTQYGLEPLTPMRRVEDLKIRGGQGYFERPTFGEPAGEAWSPAHIAKR